jgi:hypothetical protein
MWSALGRRVWLVTILKIIRIMLVVGIVWTGLQQKHGTAGVLGQTRGHHAPG